MRKRSALCLILLIFSSSVFGQEAITVPKREPCNTGYSTRDATILSMMGWGVCLALGIALLCGSLEQDTK